MTTTLNAVRDRLRAVYAATLLGNWPIIARTRYRTAARRDVEQLLEVASPFDGIAHRVPIATRAQLVMIARNLEATANSLTVFEYLSAIIADAPPAELEERVLETESVALMRRFHRWMPMCNRARVKSTITVAEVMLS